MTKPAKFNVGDKVTDRHYKDIGVGVVTGVHNSKVKVKYTANAHYLSYPLVFEATYDQAHHKLLEFVND